MFFDKKCFHMVYHFTTQFDTYLESVRKNFPWTVLRGETKVNLTDLMNVKRHHDESIDDYLSRFRQMKARCFTQIPEHELVQMVAAGLDYSIRKKLVNQQLRDMAQLADRVRQIEQLQADQIFDVLVKDKQIKLLEDKIPSPDQLKCQRYCKYHNR